VLAALAAQFRMQPSSLSQLGGGREDSDGIVFTSPSPDGDRLLKVLAIAPGDQDGLRRFEERLNFVRFLGQNNVRIVYPLPCPDGSILAVQHSAESSFIAYQMAKAPGSHPREEEWQPEFFAQWGKTIGRLHRITQRYLIGSVHPTSTRRASRC